MSGHLSDLTPEELTMLGHALRYVPDNACLTGASALRLGGNGVLMFGESEHFLSLWNKVAAAVRERDDMSAFRATASPAAKETP